MSDRTFYRTVLEIEVISEVPYDPHKELDEIAEDITTGDCNGDVRLISSNEEMDGPTTARRLLDSGSTPDFFRLDEDGNDIEED